MDAFLAFILAVVYLFVLAIVFFPIALWPGWTTDHSMQ
jgi:hypothetical protein